MSIPKICFYTSFLIFLFFYSSAQACTDKFQPKVNITVDHSPPTLNHRLNEQGIFQLRMGKQGTDNPYKSLGKEKYIGSGVTIKPYMAGLTLSSTSFLTQVNVSAINNVENSLTCFDITYNLNIKAKDDVYITNSLQKGTCEYTAALRHEYLHVQIHKNIIANNIEYFKTYIHQSLNEFLNVIYGSQTKSPRLSRVETQLAIYMNGKIQELLETYTKFEREEQQKIDTAQEYLKVRRECTHLNKYRALGALLD